MSDYQRIGNDRQFRNDDDPVLSTGKLCKYFFTQMSVTVIVLVVFESQTTDPHFKAIESFLVGMCLILVVDLLFFLFKSGTNHSDSSDNFSSNRSSILEVVLNIISGIIYFTMIGWLIYGNCLYFSLPPGNYLEDSTPPEPVTDEVEVAVTQQFDPNKWLYVSLMSVLTIGYIHLICFIAMVISIVTYFTTKLMYDEETHYNRFGHLSPCKMWKFIDEGLFSLLDEIDDDFEDLDYEDRETRSIAERKLACDKLSEKAYENVRQDTFKRIREGVVAGNLRSF